MNRRNRHVTRLLLSSAIALFIVNSGLLSPKQSSRAQAEAETPTSIRFAVIGDYGSNSQNEAAVAHMINGWNPDLIITVGDNRYGTITYEEAVGQYFCDYLADAQSGLKCPGGNAANNAFFPTLGNHDYTDGGKLDEYLDYFHLPGANTASTYSSGTERYYDFVVGPVHFFALDSQGILASSTDLRVQQDWLKAALASSTSAWNVVFFHHAAYSSSPRHGSSVFMQWPFEAWGADVVLGGHNHTYERLQVGGIPYFVVGTSGQSLNDISSPLPQSVAHHSEAFGAMVAIAGDEGILYEYYTVGGILIDSVVVGKPPPTQTPLQEPMRPGSGTLERAISQPGDDVEELATNGTILMNSRDLELVEDFAHPDRTQVVGLRFTDIAVRRNATIRSAHLEFVVEESSDAPTYLQISGEAVGDAQPFAISSYNISVRPLTFPVTWNDVSAWKNVGHGQRTPDLSDVVQQIVSLPTWSEGNAMVFVITGSGMRTAAAYDASAGVAPRLYIEYEYQVEHIQFLPIAVR